jgi:hypothetical protein
MKLQVRPEFHSRLNRIQEAAAALDSGQKHAGMTIVGLHKHHGIESHFDFLDSL